MGSNANHRSTRAVLAACLLVAAGCSQPEPEPSPSPFARELAGAPRSPREQPAEPVVAAFEFAMPPPTPAPMGEARLGAAAARKASVLLGNGAVAADAGLAAAFGREDEAVALTKTACTDRDAIELMLLGRADFAVIAGKLSSRDQHAGLRQTPIGIELWGLAVADASPLRSLSRAQMRQVLTGEVRDFLRLGQPNGAIHVFVPADADAARRAAKALIPGDPLGAMSTALADGDLLGALREPGAIGVIRIGAAPLPDGVRLLAIDWSQPTADAFRFGTYPFGSPLTLVTQGQPAGAAATFLAFARSADGQAVIGRSLLPTP